MKSSFQLPRNCLGADLVWWRESPSLHTAVTIYGVTEEQNEMGPGVLPPICLECALFSPEGQFQLSWREPLPHGGMVVIDSTSRPGIVGDGLLAIFPCTETEVPQSVRRKYRRLYSMVDWYSEEREIASFHNDQSLSRAESSEFTEIVILETAQQHNSLVVLNGAERQSPGSIQVVAQNHRGEQRDAVYAPALPAFSVHRLCLSMLFPGLAEFGEGRHISISGGCRCPGTYIRPYVVAEGRSLNAYHGGDRYEWDNIPHFVQKFLGRGEVNPMVAVHQKSLTTSVNLLNSHGHLEDDFWVDARLYDEGGRLIAERERWLLARRNGLARGEIADLLPDAGSTFAGHIALNFSNDKKAWYPRRLQALLEYSTPVSAARVMAWSDVWNGRHKMRELKDTLGSFLPLNRLFPEQYINDGAVTYHCHYRLWFRPPIVSHIAITNCGIEPDYGKHVPYVLKLHNRAGETLDYRGELAPQATDWGRIDKFFPGVDDFAGSDAIVMATVDSPADLAVMHLTEHERSGVFSAEHFMASGTYHEGQYYRFCGS
jgi:hypothetical protein